MTTKRSRASFDQECPRMCSRRSEISLGISRGRRDARPLAFVLPFRRKLKIMQRRSDARRETPRARARPEIFPNDGCAVGASRFLSQSAGRSAAVGGVTSGMRVLSLSCPSRWSGRERRERSRARNVCTRLSASPPFLPAALFGRG